MGNAVRVLPAASVAAIVATPSAKHPKLTRIKSPMLVLKVGD